MIAKLIDAGNFQARIKGSSMLPHFREGEMVRIKKLERDLQVGDVVLTKNDMNEDLILHRIVFLNNEHLITKGDNNSYVDLLCKKEDVIGICEKDWRNSRHYLETSCNEAVKKIVNIWSKNFTSDLLNFDNFLNSVNIQYINSPGKLLDDAVNVAITPFSVDDLSDSNIYLNGMKKICFHLDAPISNFLYNGFVLDQRFQYVYRSGTYLASYLSTTSERLFFLAGQISLLKF